MKDSERLRKQTYRKDLAAPNDHHMGATGKEIFSVMRHFYAHPDATVVVACFFDFTQPYRRVNRSV
jgi:hypothetical protein